MVEHGAWAQQAFQELHCALHPEGAAISELVAEGVQWSRVTALYPFDLAAYAPTLHVLLEDAALTKEFIAQSDNRVRTGRVIFSASTLQTTGASFADAELDAVDDFFASEAYSALFTAVMIAYTDHLRVLPKPAAGRTPSGQANTQVDGALRELCWAAWLVAHWEQLLTPEQGDSAASRWANTALAQDILKGVIADAQEVVRLNWALLLRAALHATIEL